MVKWFQGRCGQWVDPSNEKSAMFVPYARPGPPSSTGSLQQKKKKKEKGKHEMKMKVEDRYPYIKALLQLLSDVVYLVMSNNDDGEQTRDQEVLLYQIR